MFSLQRASKISCLGLLGLGWVVGIKLHELGQLLSCGRGAQIDFAPLAGCLCLKQFLTCQSFPDVGVAVYRGGFASPLQQPCTSSATLNLKEKGDGRSYFYFLRETREKKGGTLCHLILEKKKKSDSIEILPCLLFVLLLLSPSVFG